MVSRHGQPSGVAYPTSKFAVNGMTLFLASDIASYITGEIIHVGG